MFVLVLPAQLVNLLSVPTSIDLFCGAGGLTLGLARSGIDVRLGSDSWDAAAATFGVNFPSAPILSADARELSATDLISKAGLEESPDVVVGGPPCQGFSSAGSKDGDDPRNTLVSVYARLVADLHPRVVVFENVEGFVTAKGGKFVVGLLDPLIEAGYRVSLEKVNVANFGVPQLRKRFIAIGVLDGSPPVLAATHRAWGAPGVHLATMDRQYQRTPTVDEALQGLPAPSATAPGIPIGHVAAVVGTTDAQRIALLQPGQTMRDLPEELWHSSYRRRAHRRVMDGTPVERRGGAPAGLRRLKGDEPSRAITSAAMREFIHPSQDRPLTLREAARLQTFPDEFVFCGSRGDAHTLVGNAVPPVFAEVIGTAICQHLAAVPHIWPQKGELVRFQPTLAEGMSPALADVVSVVKNRYMGKGELPLWD